MKVFLSVMILCLMVLSITVAVADPSYIYGLHDNGGEYLMANKNARGWIVFTVAVGSDPNDLSGGDYSSWANAGYGIIVRLNNGYGSSGTLPYESSYDNFATRCKNYVNASNGVTYWIIGNECNLPREWPGNNNGDPNSGEAITVARYASCYNKCYTQIKSVKPGALLCVAPSGTWAPPYDGSLGLPNRGIPGFVTYWSQCLTTIGASKVDGIALHAYTHGCDPALVTSNQLMGDPYSTIYYHFRVYKNYMQSMPTGFTTKPVMITECDENVECADGSGYTWSNTNSGWVRAVYSEINSWNQNNAQKIRCVALFRWTNTYEGSYNYGISPRQGVIDDFNQAIDSKYTWGTASTGTISGNVKNQAAENMSGVTITTSPATSTVTTDANGNYTISNVTAGTYSVTASTSGFNSSTQTGKTVSGGQTTTVNFTLSFIDNMNGNTPTGSNLALSAASATADTEYNTSQAAGYAKDGSTSTKWCSTNASSTHWLVYDLGATKTVNGFVLKNASTGGEYTYLNTKNFKIQSSTSTSGPWTDETIVDNSAQAATISKTYNAPKSLRYIRLYITNCGVDNYARIPEFEVWGSSATPTNLALKAVTYLECGHNDSTQRAKYICDGNTSTKWCCLHNGISTAGDHWIAFDLGNNASVTSFVVKHASTGGEATYLNTKSYVIESASSLMGPWTQEFSVDNSASAATTTSTYGTAKNLRYVRLRVTQPNPSADWAVRIPEFEVWGIAGTAQPVQIEAENYDRFYGAVDGTEYHDSDAGNSGGAYRNQNVDIESCSEGTYDVGWIYSGEWLIYPWQATTTTYTPTIRYAAAQAATCRIYVDGVDKTGAISLASTGGYQTWATKSVSAITVTTGWHDIKLSMEGSGFNVNYFTLTP